MTISYNWLSEYLPEPVAAEKLSEILTSIGLEVESLHKFEEIPGGLQGLVVGEVISCEKHPDADKLRLTKVVVGADKILNIVCGAVNVAAGQKVIVAPVGSTIYPINGEPFTLKKAKIRGAESEGMICAEDEIGIGVSHDGIKVLPAETIPGTAVADLFRPYQDYIFEIGLTPNRMDAMSHLGVAKDVCAWLSHHHGATVKAKLPYPSDITADEPSTGITVTVENPTACKRYSGISINNITVTDSPKWLQEKLKAIGLKPINNIVDITNYILHETGQPLHAFDADKITSKQVIVKTLSAGTLFKTLDDKERKLTAGDLMICNAAEPMCIAGVYGGINSGVTNHTKNIFLESACFDAGFIRKTSLHHDLRTDAATRFEKGTDISNTIPVLIRAATMMKELAGGKIAGEPIDVFPDPPQKMQVTLPHTYLKKLSGKEYAVDAFRNILVSLGFEITTADTDATTVAVPFHKTDISIPADIVEEIMRIDGLDNIEIPSTITIAPSIETDKRKYILREKISGQLTGAGFNEIFTNSISNSAFYNEAELKQAVKMINSLSADLDMLRPKMIQSGLQVIAHNLNRKNHQLRFFEFGKTYSVEAEGKFNETHHLTLYVSGSFEYPSWKIKPAKADFYYLKGIIENILQLAGVKNIQFDPLQDENFAVSASLKAGNQVIGQLGEVSGKLLKQFDIKAPVFFADINWSLVLELKPKTLQYREISKFPVVNRDLAVVVDKNVSYNQVEQIALSSKIDQLKSVQLFDVFESEKLGAGKKSMAVSFTFLDENKTLTDVEIDSFMQKIISGYEKSLQAEIRK